MSQLHDRHCVPCEGSTPPMDKVDIQSFMKSLSPDWRVADEGHAIERTFRFPDFHQTMAFVNAAAWVAHREDHHPDLQVGYDRCLVRFTTHAIGGLSENDFICAARVDRLLED
ncbi:4a-hydroxytetrahydrobiopterin dehydratase [Ectothiorhodospira lacustris]|uniref:4a-hydroxytetrahydrobiopterin dehydratase n=1 Tax=Ectothiorhodospira lacustris TaxID=2899127 RepID=UPI001EE8C89B|nr:4a-hydroxytetrahydrobiopterin dehydratase [Ectothiorhodospira lacustris]MCG5500542.1 4a-hydroxytetrahydrobiopterin dehydratase [Ectothiorhodospira lacustris]MCG5509385.1 4a-hydroxytetrahydrobiopterin dehydratase [Ectothiorhodospira lacustris]MCG5521439.1 4a-hydroxytetrahydrobiopterin dehydratase [Ectothiorhodospira lacustris]